MKSIARIHRFARIALHPTGAPSRLVGRRQILLRKACAVAKQARSPTRQVARPSSTPRPRPSPPAYWSSPSPRQCAHSRRRPGNGSPCYARFIQRLRAPRTQRPVFQMTPQRRVLNEVLQVAISRARRIAHPRRHKDADRCKPLRMHIEKSKDLRLGIAKRVPHRPGFAVCVSSGSSITNFMPSAHSRLSCPAGMPSRLSMAWPTAPTGPSPTTVSLARTSMPATNPLCRRAVLVHSLVCQPHADNPVAGAFGILGKQRFAHRHRRPDLNQPRGHQSASRPTG